MKLACQINTYKGDGSPLETEYKFCEIQIDTNDSNKCFVSFIGNGYKYGPKIYFTLKEFKMHDLGMSVVGINNENCGKIDIILGGYATPIYDLTCIAEEYKRLLYIYKNTKKYFIEQYMPVKDYKTYDVTDNEIMNLAKKNFNHDLEGNRKRYI